MFSKGNKSILFLEVELLRGEIEDASISVIEWLVLFTVL